MSTPVRQRGLTLVELVTSIVILAVATAGLVLALQATVGRSGDPLLQEQASAIAQAYVEEIALKSFCDPDWDPDGDPATPLDCPSACTARACDPGGCRVAAQGATTEASRPLYDDVCDYAGLDDAGARDQTGTALAGLGRYRVQVGIEDAGVTLDTLDSDAGQVVLINVRVSHPAMESDLLLSTHRANY